MRAFSDSAEYQAVDQERWYTPNNAVSGRTVVFDASAATEQKNYPFELKDAAIKHGFTMGVVFMWNYIATMGGFYPVVQAMLAANCVRVVINFKTSSISKVVLLEGGTKVEFTTGGGTKTVNIRDIKKQEHEKTLIETYEEALMFPLKVGAKTYYLNG